MEEMLLLIVEVSLTAWDRYVNATDESEKTEALNDHRKSIKAHIDSERRKIIKI